MLTIRRSIVPQFMKNSFFYSGLDVLDDAPFDVPTGCFKIDSSVRSKSDLVSLLQVVRFWGLYTFPLEIYEYILSYTLACFDQQLVHRFPELSLQLSKILHVKKATASNRIAVSISAGLGVTTTRILHQLGYAWNETACASAALMNDLECLVYLHTENCPLDDSTLLAAVEGNSIESLQYALNNGCPRQRRVIMDSAAHMGRTDCMRILKHAGTCWDSVTFAAAIRGNQLEVLRFMHTQGCDSPHDASRMAVLEGNVEMLAFLHENGSDLTNTLNAAASVGSVSCLQYAHEHGEPWHADVCIVAARGGHLHCLRYAHEHGCLWNEETVKAAVSAQSWECLMYALWHGCGWWQHCVAALYLTFTGSLLAKIVQETGRHVVRWCLEVLCLSTGAIVFILILYRQHVGKYLSVRHADRISQSYFCMLLIYVAGNGILEASWVSMAFRAVALTVLTSALVVVNVYHVIFEVTFNYYYE